MGATMPSRLTWIGLRPHDSMKNRLQQAPQVTLFCCSGSAIVPQGRLGIAVHASVSCNCRGAAKAINALTCWAGQTLWCGCAAEPEGAAMTTTAQHLFLRFRGNGTAQHLKKRIVMPAPHQTASAACQGEGLLLGAVRTVQSLARNQVGLLGTACSMLTIRHVASSADPRAAVHVSMYQDATVCPGKGLALGTIPEASAAIRSEVVMSMAALKPGLPQNASSASKSDKLTTDCPFACLGPSLHTLGPLQSSLMLLNGPGFDQSALEDVLSAVAALTEWVPEISRHEAQEALQKIGCLTLELGHA